MEIMGCQHQMLGEALAGYIKTGIPLVAFDGNVLKPAGLGDDIGIYYFIPKIASIFGISIDQSVDILFMGVILLSVSLGIIGFLFLLKRPLIKVLGIAELTGLAYGSSFLSITYIFLSSVTIGIIPLFLYFCKRRKLGFPFLTFLILAGTVIGVAHELRSNAGTGVLIFMIIILLFYLQINRTQKIGLIILVAASVLVPMVYFGHVSSQRDVYLGKNNPTYVPVPKRHALWHSIYIGFGFLNNEYGIRYKDEIAMERVRLVSPETIYLSQRYETILKKEVFSFIKRHPLFVAQTIFAKFGVICLYLLIFTNVGLIALSLRRKCWQLEIAFWSAMIFNSLFGVVVIPDYRYLAGFIAFATLYGIFSLDGMIEYGTWGQILTFFRWNRGSSECAG